MAEQDLNPQKPRSLSLNLFPPSSQHSSPAHPESSLKPPVPSISCTDLRRSSRASPPATGHFFIEEVDLKQLGSISPRSKGRRVVRRGSAQNSSQTDCARTRVDHCDRSLSPTSVLTGVGGEAQRAASSSSVRRTVTLQARASSNPLPLSPPPAPHLAHPSPTHRPASDHIRSPVSPVSDSHQAEQPLVNGLRRGSSWDLVEARRTWWWTEAFLLRDQPRRRSETVSGVVLKLVEANMTAPSNSDRQIYRLPAPPPGDPPTTPLPKPPVKASQGPFLQPRTTPQPSEGISNVSSYGDSQDLLVLPAVGDAHGGEDPGLSAAHGRGSSLSSRSSGAASVADGMMLVVGGGDGRFIGKGETSSRRVSDNIHDSASRSDASGIPTIWTVPERVSLVASPGSVSDRDIDLGEPNHDDDGLDGDWVTVSETRPVADDGPVKGSTSGGSMVQHPADERFDHVFRVRQTVPSGQPILVPAYTFEGGMGFPNRNALTPPSPVATVSPSRRSDGEDPVPAPGGAETAASRRKGKGKERANWPFAPRFLGRHESEDHGAYELEPMAGPSSRGLPKRRARMSAAGTRSGTKWTRSLEPLIEKPRRAAASEDLARSGSPLPQRRIVTADGLLLEDRLPHDDDDDDAVEALPASVPPSRVSSTPGVRRSTQRLPGHQLSGHRIATASPSHTVYLEAFARPASSARQQSASRPSSQLDYRLRRLPRKNSSIATGTAREKKMMSRLVLFFCMLFPPLLLLFGYGALDGVMLALSKGRIERFGRQEKRVARVLGWGLAGACILGTLIGIVVTLVRR